ncbi:hypothetical protein HWV62_33769 [Athelia sp. TMB]|nr:hypothetical protein HWV62_33769 [Athelia sp. TMB]
MEQEALIAGLHFLPPVINDWTIDGSAPHDTLRDGVWRALELLPIAHERQTSRTGASIGRPHLGEGRVILPGQKIHVSVAFKSQGYVPKAVFQKATPDSATPNWADILGKGPSGGFRTVEGWKDLLALDIFGTSSLSALIKMLRDGRATAYDRAQILDRLRFLRSQPDLEVSARAQILEFLPVDELIPLLGSKDCPWAAQTLSVVVMKDDARGEFIENGGVEVLIEMLDGKDLHSALLVLKTLMRYSTTETQVKILEAGALPLLVRLLETESCCAAAAAALSSLQGGLSLEFAKSDAIPKLLRRGRSGKWDVVAEALAWLTHNANAKTRMIKANVVFALIPALKEEGSEKFAAEILAKLAQDSESCRKSITSSNIIPLLVAMLNGKHSKSSVEALHSLVSYPPACKKIDSARAIPALVTMLQETIRGQAAYILACLAYDDTEARANTIRNDAIPPLADMLNSEADRAVAMETLKCLIWHDEGRIQFLTDDTIPLLVNTLNYTDSRRDAAFALACVAEKMSMLKVPTDWTAATQALRWLARDGRARKRIVESNGIPGLVSTLKISKTRLNAAWTLMWLAQSDEQAQEECLHYEVIAPLVQMLDSSLECAIAIETLQVLSRGIDGKLQIIRANILPAIVSALRHAAMRKHAANLLAGLAEYGPSQINQIVALQAISTLLEMLKDPTAARSSALAAIHAIASNGILVVILESNLIPDLLEFLADEDDIADRAIGMLAMLASKDDARTIMVQNNVAIKLGSMISAKITSHEAVAVVLYELSKHAHSTVSSTKAA